MSENPKEWVYLSPHPDDVAISCGGLVWEQAHSGDRVSIWTICAGDPPAGLLSPFAQGLERRWQTGHEASSLRRAEDAASCNVLGASWRHFPFPDCIYRSSPVDGTALYASEEALFGPLHPSEQPLVAELCRLLEEALPTGAQVVCPLAVGGHVDHRLTRSVAEAVARRLRRPLWYFADYPYAAKAGAEVAASLQSGKQAIAFDISPPGIAAWEQSIYAHRSQISTFWADFAALQADVHIYCKQMGGVRLWRPPY
jgi:LmbE family N-acetylglucosaminyl deacetylase